MSLILRSVKGSRLTTAEMDANLQGLADGSLITGLSSTASPTLGDYLVGVKLDLTDGAARNQHDKNAEIVSITDFLNDDGTQVSPVTGRDNGTGFQNAVDALEATTFGRALIHVPAGTYLKTLETRIHNDRIGFIGDGPQATSIDFRPTGTATCFLFQKSTAAQIVQNSFRGIGFISGGGNTQIKTALNVVDGNLFVCEDFAVTSWAGTSIGIKLNGRDVGYFSRIAIGCSRPLLISTNPNYAPIDLDHHEFRDLYLICTGSKCIEIEDAVDLSNISFTGQQSWVGGDYGLYWVGSTATGNSYPLSIHNLRTEQGNTGLWPIYIDLTGTSLLQSFSLYDSTLGIENGIYMRGVSRISLRNVATGGGAGKTALDITAQARSLLVCDNVQVQDSATVTLTNFSRLMESMPTSTNSPLGEFAVYCYNGNTPLMRQLMVTSANLPAALASRSGGVVLEDAGRGHIDVVAYGSAERRRIGKAITKRVELFDDFLGDLITDEWGSAVGSDPQVVAPAIISARYGQVSMTTGDDAAASMAVNGVQLHSQLNWQPSVGEFACEFRFKISAITNVSVFVGMTDQISILEMPIRASGVGDGITTDSSNAVGVMFDTNMATDNWWGVGVATDVDATSINMAVAPTADTFETWRIEVNEGTGAATFYRNGTVIGTVLSGAITAGTRLTPVIAAFSTAAASRTITADYVLVEGTRGAT